MPVSSVPSCSSSARRLFLGVDATRVDLIDEARDALLSQGDREAAAEAEISGLARSMRTAWLPMPLSGLAPLMVPTDAPPSPAKANVVANHARLLALTESHEEALVAAREALAIAEELELPDLEANALNTIGLARVLADDFAGISDMEESLRLALEQGSLDEIARTYNNLGGAYAIEGRTEEASQMFVAQLDIYERFGLPTYWAEAQVLGDDYQCGRWEDALRRADDLLGKDCRR